MTRLEQPRRHVLLHNRDRRCPFCGSSRLMVTRGTTTVRQTYRADAQFSCCGCGNIFEMDELAYTEVSPPLPKPVAVPKRPKPPTRYRIQCRCGAEFRAIVSQQVATACPWCDRRYRVAADTTGRLYNFKVGNVAQK